VASHVAHRAGEDVGRVTELTHQRDDMRALVERVLDRATVERLQQVAVVEQRGVTIR
jgi:hypothetical protein